MTWCCFLIHSSLDLSNVRQYRWRRQHCATGELLIFDADFHSKIVQSPFEWAKCHSNRWGGVWVAIYHICCLSWDCPKGFGFKLSACLHLVQQRGKESSWFKPRCIIPSSYATHWYSKNAVWYNLEQLQNKSVCDWLLWWIVSQNIGVLYHVVTLPLMHPYDEAAIGCLGDH